MNNEVTNYNEYRGGDYFAEKAAEYRKTCTKEENARRSQNGRQSNVAPVVAIIPGREVPEAVSMFRSLPELLN